MRLSIIVCTRNRAQAIIPCLDSIAVSLANAAPVDAEIVVVDNASEDNTSTVVREWASSSSFPVNLQFEPRKGIAVAHNCGLRVAQGELVVSTDDDCRMDKDYMQNLLRHDAGDTGPVLRGGRVELGDPSDLPLTIKTDRTPKRWSRKIRSARHENLGNCLHGCNMAIRRKAFVQLGPYDELFCTAGIPAGEDTDYIFRAYLAGMTIEYAPDMVVFHHHGRKTMADGNGQFRNYMIASGALYAKYIFKDPDLCRQFYWDIKNAAREIIAGKNTFMPEIGFSHKDRVIYTVLGALRYFFGLIRAA